MNRAAKWCGVYAGVSVASADAGRLSVLLLAVDSVVVKVEWQGFGSNSSRERSLHWQLPLL